MTQNEVLHMAIDAGATDCANPDKWGILEISYESLERFAALVAAHDTKREWVGLTKEEAKEISLANRPYVIDMIAALEARLKEKNGG